MSLAQGVATDEKEFEVLEGTEIRRHHERTAVVRLELSCSDGR